MSYAVSWSGGKDGCFACYKALQGGYDIRWMVNSISDDHGRVRFHGTEARLIQLQAQATGIALVQNRTSAQHYEEDFKRALRPLIDEGLAGMIFGDIYVPENRRWVEKVCRDLSIEAVLPLWGRDPKELFREFIDAGFRAVMVGADSRRVDKEWIGRPLDRRLLAYLESHRIDPCGENGEYHTFVVDGPLFQQAIEITSARTVAINGYWFLDTEAYGLRETGPAVCIQTGVSRVGGVSFPYHLMS
jgi:uncharacterized protein (TIGR00290 family)